MPQPTTGTALLDDLVDGVRIGDNLVLVGSGAAPLELLVERFLAAEHPQAPVRIRLAPGDGGEAPADPAAAIAAARRADERAGEGAVLVLDDLDEAVRRWGHDAALEVFLATCPQLYRRRSLALWTLRGDHHPASFLRRLSEITQVLVEIDGDASGLELHVRRADGRAAAVTGRHRRAVIRDGDLCRETPDVGEQGPPRGRGSPGIGAAIRAQRAVRGLSQAEVARQVGISPSALSQVERGVRGPSGDTLVRLWEVLGVPFGPPAGTGPGYRVARRSAHGPEPLGPGLTGQPVLEDDHLGALWVLRAAPGARADRGPFATKAAETVLVVDGVLDLDLGAHRETLHPGDAVVATTVQVTGWHNPGTVTTELVWLLHPAATRRVP